MIAMRILVTSTIFALAACGGSQPPPPAAEAKSIDEASGPPLRGSLAKDRDKLAFHECGTPGARVLTVVDPSGEAGSALKTLGEGATAYVEFEGAVSGDHVTVSRLLRARGPREGVACELPVFAGDYVASGNEPFWSVEIRDNGIVFRSPEEPKGTAYPYALTPSATGAAEYATKIESPRVSTLEAVIEPGRCVDSMSGDVFGFKAHVVRDGKKLEGCAAAGVPTGGFGGAPLDELARHLGTYPDATLWTTPPVGARLDVLLGTKGTTFRQNIEVHTPLMKDGGVYYVMGNRPHRGGIDNALFIADPESDTIEVILFVGGVREDFKEGGRDVALPDEVVKMLGSLPAP